MRENISCRICRHRHPADRTCNDAALIADLQAQLQQTDARYNNARAGLVELQQQVRRDQEASRTQAAQRREMIAVAAPAGLLAGDSSADWDAAAEQAVGHADALIAELDKPA